MKFGVKAIFCYHIMCLFVSYILFMCFNIVKLPQFLLWTETPSRHVCFLLNLHNSHANIRTICYPLDARSPGFLAEFDAIPSLKR